MNNCDGRQLPLAGKWALVTGSTSGIGKAIAIGLATAGADIIVHGRRESDRSRATVSQIESLGGRATTCMADFSDRSQLESFVDSAWPGENRLDILVNNAGGDVLTGDWPSKTFSERLDYLWDVDVRATLLLSRALGRRMQAAFSGRAGESGVILNMGWDQAWQGMEGESAEMFATTKGAIMSMTKSLAQSLAPEVRVNCVAPGWIKTEWAEGASADWNQRAKKQSLMQRWGKAEDVAELACFLSSDAAKFIAGQIIRVNGGFNYFSG